SGWFSPCATSTVGRPKKCVTSCRFPRLIRGCCSIGRGQRCVVFLKITFQLQAHGVHMTARTLKRGIVIEPELTCKELTELITDYLEERLPQSERTRFEEHLSGCRGCVTYLDQMRFTLKALGSQPQLEIPSAIQSDLLKAFRHWKDSD